MRYLVQQKFWSLGGEFTIKDGNEQDAYRVRGQAFSWGHKLSLQDMGDRELAYISQRLMTWKPTYEIYRDGAKFAEVTREASWLKSRFTLDVPGPNDYTITGSFWDHEYVFERGGRAVATVSKRFWSWTDTYGIDVIEGEDDVAVLATCIVIDLVNGDENAAGAAT